MALQLYFLFGVPPPPKTKLDEIALIRLGLFGVVSTAISSRTDWASLHPITFCSCPAAPVRWLADGDPVDTALALGRAEISPNHPDLRSSPPATPTNCKNCRFASDSTVLPGDWDDDRHPCVHENDRQSRWPRIRLISTFRTLWLWLPLRSGHIQDVLQLALYVTSLTDLLSLWEQPRWESVSRPLVVWPHGGSSRTPYEQRVSSPRPFSFFAFNYHRCCRYHVSWVKQLHWLPNRNWWPSSYISERKTWKAFNMSHPELKFSRLVYIWTRFSTSIKFYSYSELLQWIDENFVRGIKLWKLTSDKQQLLKCGQPRARKREVWTDAHVERFISPYTLVTSGWPVVETQPGHFNEVLLQSDNCLITARALSAGCWRERVLSGRRSWTKCWFREHQAKWTAEKICDAISLHILALLTENNTRGTKTAQGMFIVSDSGFSEPAEQNSISGQKLGSSISPIQHWCSAITRGDSREFLSFFFFSSSYIAAQNFRAICSPEISQSCSTPCGRVCSF